MSGAAGMRGVLAVDGCLPRVCTLLAHSHTDAAKLVVEMLIKLCLFSADGYRLAVKVCRYWLVQVSVLWYLGVLRKSTTPFSSWGCITLGHCRMHKVSGAARVPLSALLPSGIADCMILR